MDSKPRGRLPVGGPRLMWIDLTHTSHSRARTGVQRVARELFFALQRRETARPITWDPYARIWRELENWENENLNATAPGQKRSAQWPWLARWRGRMRAWRGRAEQFDGGSGLIVPEIFSPAVESALPDVFARTRGPRIAIFHDAIALQFPELSPAKTVARFPGYLQALARFDGVAAVSTSSLHALVGYWDWLGLKDKPTTTAIPLGLAPSQTVSAPAANTVPRVLCVGTLEGRKNHVALFAAAEKLWSEGVSFELHVIGFVQRETGAAAQNGMRALIARGRPLVFHGTVDDAKLARAYAACDFTVYPSLIEGFGLPVLESLQHGKPCVCTRRGALGEAAAGGGCLTLDAVNAESLATAMRALIDSPARRQELAAQAKARRFRSWDDYSEDLVNWMQSLQPRRLR